MSVGYLLVFTVCQAVFVQPDGITLPFTFLTYKSVPANPKEGSLSLENSENAETPTKTVNFKHIEVNSSTTSPESSLQQSKLKSIIPTNSKNVQTKPTEQIEGPIKIRSFSPNIATTQGSKLPPINLSNEGSNIKDNSIYYSSKTKPFTTTENYLDNKKNNDVVNLESSLRIGFNDVPYSTCSANQVNIQPKYLDCNKQMNLEFERNTLNPVIQKLEKDKVVPDWENIQKDNLNKVKNNIDGSDVLINRQLLQTMNKQKYTDKNTSCNENIKLMEKPNTRSKVFYPIDNIVFNSGSNLANSNQVINVIQAETIGKKKYNNSNAYNENNVELIVTPSVKFQSDKVNAIPCNIEISDCENINNVAIVPVCPLNYVPSQIPLCETYSYGAKEMPKVYIPNGYTYPSKIAISRPGPNVSPASSSSIYKVSDTYNCIKEETVPEIVTKSSANVPNFNRNNCVMSKCLVGVDSPNIIPTISPYYPTPSHTTKVPVLSQLPDVYTPKISFSQPLSSHVDSNPTNVIFNDVPDISCVNSIDNRFPTSVLSNVDHTMLRPTEHLNLLIPIFRKMDKVPPCQPKCIIQNDVKPSTTPHTTLVKNNLPNLQPPEYVSPITLPLSPANIPCPSKSTVIKTNLYSSPLTESLNDIISYLTSGLLSAFCGLNTKSDEVVSPISTDCPTSTSIHSDVPSSIYSETSISVAMPLYMLNPPQLPSPTSLPTPNVLPLKDCNNKSLLKEKPVEKKPKAYISSITINVIPSNEEVNDIIVLV